MPEPTDLTLKDRMILALTWLQMRAEQRDGFFSDDDVLDAICQFTTEDLNTDEPPVEWGDYECLSQAVWLTLETAANDS